MTLEEMASQVAEECQQVGIHLAEHGENVKRRLNVLRTVNVVVSIAVFVSVIPVFAVIIGISGIKIMSAVAGFVLLLDTVLPIFASSDNPERYEDYGKYMMGYRDTLYAALVNANLTGAVREARLTEVIALAQSNMRDVRSKWPKLVRKALGQVRTDE